MVSSLSAGCASRASSSPFIIRKGRGPIEINAPGLKPLSRDEIARAERQASAARAQRRPPIVPSIEQKDPGLRRALAALRNEPSTSAHLDAAVAYQQLGVLDAAFDHVSRAIALEPRNASAWDARARLWREWGMIAPALVDVHRARYFAPRRADVLNTLGTILERAGQCGNAAAAYREAMGLDEHAEWARQNLTRVEALRSDCRPGR
jgi:tetratricopeptide (TPR) repeat protein